MDRYKYYKECARQKAINWQSDCNNPEYSWLELAMFQEKFEKLGKRYGLTKEFKENGII